MISVIIPCLSTHLNDTNLRQAIASILDGTKIPDTIILVVSGIPVEFCIKKWKSIYKYLLKKYKFNNFKFIYEKKPIKCGKARQIGLDNVDKKTKIVVFCDADDTYHPQRLEVFLYFFNKYDIKAINHLFIPDSYNFENYNIERIPIIATQEEIYNYYYSDKDNIKCRDVYYGEFLKKTITDGHMCIKLPINTRFYNTNSGCDTQFLYRLCKEYKKNIIIGACLSKYSKFIHWMSREHKKKIELYDSIMCTEQARIKII